MFVITGSCGYIVPEYAYTLRVNEKSDTYSFGVVILELVTGRRPVDPEFGEKDLVKWVCTTIDQKGVDHVLDSRLDSCFKEEICKFFNIGLMCTSPLPIKQRAVMPTAPSLFSFHAGMLATDIPIKLEKLSSTYTRHIVDGCSQHLFKRILIFRLVGQLEAYYRV